MPREIISITVLLITAFMLRRALTLTQNFNNTRTMSTYISGTHSIAYVTVPTQEIAKRIAKDLVQEKLAACVNIIPNIISIYSWQGKMEEDSELLMMIKTQTNKIPELTAFVKKNHPYEVCEVISVKIDNGNDPYLQWITNSLKK
ncbi:protein CutA homolog [Ctenocephalides felis]|uniref:protein CutA homolog n=1 Tax=Ctenocephalides felis TaxID=7515 RepID=UPI000E6E2CEB|nr:protein CutA homolog [Ctenocephalides felis]